MDVTERDRLAMATEAELRAAGFDMPDGYGDIRNPSDEWRAAIDAMVARDRQMSAIRALRDLTADDVRALLEALA